MKSLTPSRAAVLNHVRVTIEVHGYAPSLRETGHALGMGESTVHGHVERLVKDGHLRRGAAHAPRSLEVVDPAGDPVALRAALEKLLRAVDAHFGANLDHAPSWEIDAATTNARRLL